MASGCGGGQEGAMKKKTDDGDGDGDGDGDEMESAGDDDERVGNETR